MRRVLLALFALSIVWGTAPASAQEIPVAQVQFVAGPDISTFAQTTSITHVDLGLQGVEVQFDKRQGPNRWPDNTTPGWQGSLQYSLGIALRIGEQWVASAPIETWFGNNVIGGQIQNTGPVCAAGTGQIACNWFYDPRWAPLTGHQPLPGTQFGVFVVAGDARNSYNPVRERSNIVLVTMPPSGVAAAFDFGSSPGPGPAPQPDPTPTPTPGPPPVPTQFCASQASVDEASAKLDRIEQALKAAQASLQPGGSFWRTLLTVVSLGIAK